ncbi:hypothetical protein KQP65_02580 [Bacteroides thetaiotaomicron]|nr:hypothetical protein [Bacteroides thetaiotaomicron]UYU62281.1 hypothetical protein KQP65_02580 [Bacteroides thetaiotaomicron]
MIRYKIYQNQQKKGLNAGKARATGNLSTTNLKLDSQLKQQAEYQKPTTPGGGGSGSGNTPDPKPNPDEGDEEAPDPTV